jgi:cell division protein FtsI/penicillin-binding protein 2
MDMNNSNKSMNVRSIRSINIIFGLLMVVIGFFMIRLFYLQVIKYNYYKQSALSDQLEQAKIPPNRGIILAHDGSQVLPIVLNQKLYTVYVDPTLVKNISSTASKIASILGGSQSNFENLMATKNTKYVVLAKKISQNQSNRLLGLQLPGIGTIGQDYRVYPQGDLASQILGFVNDDNQGNYGIEQALDKQLSGTPGYLKAITDVNGVPLAASKGNINVAPKNGTNEVLTIDAAIQKQLQEIIQNAAKSEKSPLISAVIMDSNSGAIRALANYPTYNPANYSTVNDSRVFNNAAVSNSIEPGSIMKVFTTAAALDQGVINQNTTYYDPSHWLIDGFNITNIEEDGGAGTKSIEDILNLSLNTGATWMLMQMGGGMINQKARVAWNNYMTNHFRFGQVTGIEQGYESDGIVPKPNISNESGDQQDLSYANTSFGQGLSVTALQMDSALSAVINGGTYYKPYIIDGSEDSAGNIRYNKPQVVERNTVSKSTSSSMLSLMEQVVQKHYQSGFSYLNFPSNYIVGGKTGTAQVPNPKGGYFSNVYNGTYLGFVGGNKPEYAIAIFVTTPTVNGYAGSYGAQPIFGNIVHMLINESYVSPIGN